ncbi:MAG: phosphoglucomutase [Thermodesulfobacteriota bacterium]
MTTAIDQLFSQYVQPDNHQASDYFRLIKQLVAMRPDPAAETALARAYGLVEEEIRTNPNPPAKEISFGTSGWRGIIGKDFSLKSVAQVTQAIVEMYQAAAADPRLAEALGVRDIEEARSRGAVVGYDNRFGGRLMAQKVVEVLTGNGFTVHYAAEATTGTLSASVLVLRAAFSINLTPSHNPLEYAGFKFNAADAGPAASTVTNRITENARRLLASDKEVSAMANRSLIRECDALECWRQLMDRGATLHGLDYREIIKKFQHDEKCVLAVDCVHGASRVHIRDLLGSPQTDRLIMFRDNADPTFGGVAPEPSQTNMQGVMKALARREEPLKLGVIIDPDADRIRFTDGDVQIDMNLFGAMAFHHLHEGKGKKGLVAKTVATSNFANAVAAKLGAEMFEPRVGFKEFKPVIGKALVCFEESDGISVIGHTPEKDAYIGLILALDMILSRRQNLGDYLRQLQAEFGLYCPARGGVEVSKQGKELLDALAGLERYGIGATATVGGREIRIAEVITIDGRKMIMEDGSWIMIRPSGTEPKVRFYVEARDESGKEALFATARGMLAEIGLL